MDKVRAGEGADLTTRDKHLECFVVAAEGADKARIEKEIKEMPNYFADYDTQVHFITAEELKKTIQRFTAALLPQRQNRKQRGKQTTYGVSIKLDSNPEFTASVLVAYARATYRLYMEGAKGAKTVFDIPLGYLSPKSAETLMATLL